MTTADWFAILASVAALLTTVGGFLFQKKHIDLELKKFNEDLSSEKRVRIWVDDFIRHLPSAPNDKNIDASSPYQAGAPIRNAKLFYGYQEQLSSMLHCVTREDMTSMSILGARKSGKTSFFYHLNHIILSSDKHQRIVPVLLDAQIPISGDKNFYAYMLRETATALTARKINLRSFEFTTEVELDTLRTLLEQSSAKGFRFVFLLDEFEKLVDNKQISGEGFFSSLRSLIIQANISWITTSFRAIYMPGTNTSPFTDIFQDKAYLGPLSKAETHLLISGSANDAQPRLNHEFEPEDEDLILDLAGHMPFLLQKACLSLYTAQCAGKNGEEARRHLKTTFILESEPYFQSQLSILSPEEKEALFHLAFRKDVTKYLQTLEFLEKYGFVEKTAGGYKVLGQTFEDYLYQQAKTAGLTYP